MASSAAVAGNAGGSTSSVSDRRGVSNPASSARALASPLDKLSTPASNRVVVGEPGDRTRLFLVQIRDHLKDPRIRSPKAGLSVAQRLQQPVDTGLRAFLRHRGHGTILATTTDNFGARARHTESKFRKATEWVAATSLPP
jgi:hypothetical protein